MKRDLSILPLDENGEALWRAVQNGLALGQEHRVRFSTEFPNYTMAFKFGCFLMRQGYWVQVHELDPAASGRDEVLVEMGLNATHAEISATEAWLGEHAAEFEGKPTGWQIRDQVERPLKADFAEL